MVSVTVLPPVRTLEDLVDHMKERGYRDGPPAHVHERTLQIDQQVAERCRCGRCGKRGRVCRFFNRGRSYVAVGICGGCGAAEEV